ncbi:MAG: ABC transporter permease [Pseudomonadota bacterium]
MSTLAMMVSAREVSLSETWKPFLASLLALAALAFPLYAAEGVVTMRDGAGYLSLALILGAAAIAIKRPGSTLANVLLGIGAHGAAAILIASLPGRAAPGYWLETAAAWLLAWQLVDNLAGARPAQPAARRALALLIPLLFGAWLLILWELVVRGANVPQVLLPAPSAIGATIMGSTDILWVDFLQTFKAVLIGYLIGCGSGFVVALLCDRYGFLKRGLLPIGNLASALPIVGVAPIMVMWFGFDWPSKAAVVVIMTFFPMLVNTVAGLQAAGRLERDMMHTYAASPAQGLVKLRLPAAMPFIFNALKINSTLALIGAIVAEFFGTPIVGMGFRISTEIGRMNLGMVWAEIAVAAVAGSAFYGLVAWLERRATFWHPSQRGAR